MSEFLNIITSFLEASQIAKKDEDLKSFEKEMEEDFQKIFRKQKRAYLDQLEKYKKMFAESMGLSESNKILDEVFFGSMAEMKKAIKKTSSRAYLQAAQETISDTGISFSLENPKAVEFLETRAADMVTAINETTRKRVNRIVTEAAGKGMSYEKTAQRLKNEFEEFAIGKPQKHIRSRAHLIAIQENSMAYEQGGFDAGQKMQDMGIQMEKYWGGPQDSRTSDGCRDNAAAGWIDYDQPFPSGHMFPPRFPGCRHTLLKRRKK